MSDNEAVLAGYEVEVEAVATTMDLRLLVKADTDYDSCFKAWDMDEQEWIKVNGWLFVIEVVK
jgi:hypothetical protein